MFLKERERGQAIDSSPSLPNVRVGREVVVHRVDGAGDSRADGGEERVDLFVEFCKRGREEKRVRRRKGERERGQGRRKEERGRFFLAAGRLSPLSFASLSPVARSPGSAAAQPRSVSSRKNGQRGENRRFSKGRRRRRRQRLWNLRRGSQEIAFLARSLFLPRNARELCKLLNATLSLCSLSALCMLSRRQ